MLVEEKGPTGIRTQVKGFKVPSTNRYTIEPEYRISIESFGGYKLL